MTTTTIRDLVDAARRKGRPRTARPSAASFDAVAKACGIRRSYLYAIMAGDYDPPDWTVAKMAVGLGVSEAKIRKALESAREEAQQR